MNKRLTFFVLNLLIDPKPSMVVIDQCYLGDIDDR